MVSRSLEQDNPASFPIPARTLAAALADEIIGKPALCSMQWRYDYALLLHSLLMLSETTRRATYRRFVELHAERLAGCGGAGGGYRAGVHDLEQSAVGWVLLEVWRRRRTGICLQAVRSIRKDLSLHPRTAAGVFWYRKALAYRIWLDGVAMYVPFLSSFALEFGEPELFDDVCGQLILIESWMRDAASGLLYHAWDESRKHVWAHPETGCSPHFSARGMASFGMALVEALGCLPGEHPDRTATLAMIARFAEAVVRFQDPVSGLWFHVIDQPERMRNVPDATASALLVSSLAKAVRTGWLERKHLDSALNGFRGLLSHHVAADNPSGYRLSGICPASELAITADWDGSFDWYVNRSSVSNDPFGSAAVILACTEIDRALRRGEGGR